MLSNKNFVVLSQNIRSVNANFPNLKHYLHNLRERPAVICCQEIWQPKGDFILNGFDNPLINERTHKKGGGVGIWINKSINYKLVEKFTATDGVEAILIEVSLGTNLIAIANIYRPPGGNRKVFYDYLRKLTTTIDVNRGILICGDMNIDFATDDSKELKDLLVDLNLHQHVDTLTRIGKRKGTIIDHIYTRNLEEVTTENLDTGISDHCGIRVALQNFNLAQTTQNFRYTFNKANLTKVTDNLKKINWDIFFDTLNCNRSVYKLENEIKLQVNRHCVSNNNSNANIHKIILTKSTNKLRLKLRKMRKKIRKTDNDVKKKHFAKLYRKFKSEYECALKHEWQEYNAKLLAEKDPRKLWSNINEMTDRGDKSKARLPFDNAPDTFVRYFHGIASEVESKIEKGNESINKYSQRKHTSSFEFTEITELETNKIFDSIKQKRSSGHDNLSSKAMKHMKEVLVVPITIILNKMMTERKFPEPWKLAKIIPLHKKGAKDVTGNYRPISLLPAFSKLAEKAMATQIYNFMETNNLFPNSQYGFRTQRGTHQAVCEAVARIESLKSKGKKYGVVLMDFSKAFDIINHRILYKKLKTLKFSAESITLIKSYLTDRRIYVEAEGKTSKILKCKNIGCPQGSVLGPLIYLIYTCSVGELLYNTPHVLFADDTMVITELPNDLASATSKLETLVGKCLDHFNAIRLKLNVEKTEILTNLPPITIIVNGKSLKVKTKNESAKYLGIWLNANLNWSTHINAIHSKMRNGLYAMYKLKRLGCNEKILLQVYSALILSHFNYCSPAWYFSSTKQDNNRLFTVQKAAMRCIANAPLLTRTNELCVALNLLKLSDVNKINTFGMILSLISYNANLKATNTLAMMVETIQSKTRNNGKLTTKVRSKTLLHSLKLINDEWEKITSGLTNKTIIKHLRLDIMNAYIETLADH